jgi:SlyX protein
MSPDPTNDIEAMATRIDALEMRVAYQDQTIEDLNSAVTAQRQQIESLARQIERLTDRVQEAEHRAGTSAQPDPPPPHY